MRELCQSPAQRSMAYPEPPSAVVPSCGPGQGTRAFRTRAGENQPVHTGAKVMVNTKGRGRTREAGNGLSLHLLDLAPDGGALGLAGFDHVDPALVLCLRNGVSKCGCVKQFGNRRLSLMKRLSGSQWSTFGEQTEYSTQTSSECGRSSDLGNFSGQKKQKDPHTVDQCPQNGQNSMTQITLQQHGPCHRREEVNFIRVGQNAWTRESGASVLAMEPCVDLGVRCRRPT